MRSFVALSLVLLSLFGETSHAKFLQDCSGEMEEINFSTLRAVQFPKDESQESVLNAFLDKEKKIEILIENTKGNHPLLKQQIQISIDKYINMETGTGYLPGQSIISRITTVDELIQNFNNVALKHADPINSELVNIIGNLRQSRDLGVFVLEMGKDYKIVYTMISPKLLDLKLFEYLLQSLKEAHQI